MRTLFRWEGVQAGSSVKRGAKGQTLGGLKGIKGTNIGGGRAQRKLFAISLKVLKWIRPGHTLALQSFRIIHLINAEILAKFCTMHETKINWKKHRF